MDSNILLALAINNQIEHAGEDGKEYIYLQLIAVLLQEIASCVRAPREELPRAAICDHKYSPWRLLLATKSDRGFLDSTMRHLFTWWM